MNCVCSPGPGESGRTHAVLCGHYHVQLAGHLRGVPVSVTPGVATRIDLTAPPGLVRAVRGASATVVDLGGPFSPSFHVMHARDPEAGRQVSLADGVTWAHVDDEDAGEGQDAGAPVQPGDVPGRQK